MIKLIKGNKAITLIALVITIVINQGTINTTNINGNDY